MTISALETLNNPPLSTHDKSSAQVRQVAAQFESILLTQLTSALSGTKDEGDEDSLFGNDSGTGLAKQMFAEQLANTMAESGGVGLADLIVSQAQANQPKAPSGKNNKLDNVLAAVKDIKDLKGKSFSLSPKTEPLHALPRERTSGVSGKTPLINKSPKFIPVANEAEISNSSDGIEIVSTFADEVAKYGDADLPKPVMGDEKLFRYTRARVVPDYALGEPSAVSYAPSQPITTSVNNVTELPKKLTAVNYQMPVGGRLSSVFGNRMHPIDHKIKFHAGVDLAAPKGTPIATAAEGKVTFAGHKGGYGNLVIVEHPDGRETRYGHTDKILVQEGDQVDAQQIIATVGSTGKSTGPHLHFEIRENGKPVNPLKFLP